MQRNLNGLTFQFHHWSGQALGVHDRALLVFCLHGFMDHGLTFDPLIKALGWQAFAWDARGFGQTAWIPRYDYYHFFDYLRDLHMALNTLFAETGTEQVLLLGHSMGGMIASLYAGVYPERVAGLINLEGWMIPDTSPQDVPQRLRTWLSQCGDVNALTPFARYSRPEAAQERMQRQDPRLSPAQIEYLSAPILAQDESGYFWRHDPLHRTRSPQPFRLDQAQACWEAITAPQLLLYGDDSPICKLPDRTVRWRSFGLENPERDTTVHRIAEAGHNLHLHQPDQVAQAIQAWLGARAQFKDLPGA